MKYFIDTEFHEYKKKPILQKPIDTIDLISIGIVREDGKSYYAICNEFNVNAAWNNKWLRDNVLLQLYTDKVHGDMRNYVPFSKRTIKGILKGFGKSKAEIANDIRKLVTVFNTEMKYDKEPILKHDPNPEFYAYYGDYDWVVFCWIFGRMIDLPEGFPMYCRDLKQIMDDKGLDKEWKRENCPDPKGEHNALIDAKWNLQLYIQMAASRSQSAVGKIKTDQPDEPSTK